MLVNIPSVFISILAHIAIFILFIFSIQFKPNNGSLKQYVIEFQLTEYNYNEEKKNDTITNEELFKSNKSNKKKISVNLNSNDKINKKVDNFKIKKKNLIPKKKNEKIDKKQVKFDLKKTKLQPVKNKVWEYSSFSGPRLSKFPPNSSIIDDDIRLNKYKKNLHKNIKSCGTRKKIKSKENLKNVKVHNFENKKITISELLRFNYYNPQLININRLLNIPQIEHESQVNITNLLMSKEQNDLLCD